MIKELRELTKEQAKKELIRLKNEIEHHNKLYYQLDSPVISDKEYDDLFNKNKKIEELYPDLILKDSPSKKVGAKSSSKFSKINHTKPMLSLANAFTIDDVEKFYNRIVKDLKINDPEFLCELKIDGVSISIRYEYGKLKYASTRGNGIIGEDVTENVKTIQSLPQILKDDAPDIVEVRGEIYIDHSDFIELNNERSTNNQPIFANSRNAASGSLRQLDSNITANRKLKYFIHGFGEISEKYDNQSEIIDMLSHHGFIFNKYNHIANKLDDLIDYYNNIEKIRESLGYDIDGVVYKINNIDLQNRLGDVSRNPRWAIAHKFRAYDAKTVIEKIEIQVGRIGSITPLAIVTPVNINGVMVRKASLHNRDEIDRKDIRENDTVTIKRAGDVIPQIVAVDYRKRKNNSVKFNYPDYCPSCKTKLIETSGAAIICPNHENCPAQNLERLVHFVSKSAFNIEGLGNKQIANLIDRGFIKNQVDIFHLEENNEVNKLQDIDGFGKKSIENLFNSINKSKIISLDRFIYSIGIKYIGENTSKLLAKYYKTYDDWFCAMNNFNSQETLSIDGVGPKLIESIVEFFSNENNIIMIKSLANIIDIKDYITKNIDHILANKTIVFTGELKSITRREAKMQAERCGAKILNIISSRTDYLIVGNSAGSKLKKAKDLGIKIIDENEWLNLVKGK